MAGSPESIRLWLLYPQRLVQRPIIFELGKSFDLVTNVRQATVNDDIGLVCLEVTGEPKAIQDGIVWLEKQGIKVEPVELNVIEG